MMKLAWSAWAVAIIVLGIAIWFVRLRRTTNQLKDAHEVAPATTHPSTIVIGESVSAPAVTVKEWGHDSRFDEAQTIDLNGALPERVSQILQAVPSVLVAEETGGKRLMEVVIRGDLVRASDGNGLRAFAMGPDGIKEQARLFDVQNLQNIVNAAAIWQIASVVVAQKHLADISRKLDDIADSVRGISMFLQSERKSKIEATYDYVAQVHRAIRNGELPLSVRSQLEGCERELMGILRHLEDEFRQIAEMRVEHKESFGTKRLTKDLGTKIKRLEELSQQIALCLKARTAAWYVLTLYPGEPHLKAARREDIYHSIQRFQDLNSHFGQLLRSEIGGMNARWKIKSILAKRKESLLQECSATENLMSERISLGKDALQRSQALLIENDKPTHLLLEYADGDLVAVRQIT